MKILAIDLGKFNSMCCFYETKTQKYRFQTVATTREYLMTVFKNHEIDLVIKLSNNFIAKSITGMFPRNVVRFKYVRFFRDLDRPSLVGSVNSRYGRKSVR